MNRRSGLLCALALLCSILLSCGLGWGAAAEDWELPTFYIPEKLAFPNELTEEFTSLVLEHGGRIVDVGPSDSWSQVSVQLKEFEVFLYYDKATGMRVSNESLFLSRDYVGYENSDLGIGVEYKANQKLSNVQLVRNDVNEQMIWNLWDVYEPETQYQSMNRTLTTSAEEIGYYYFDTDNTSWLEGHIKIEPKTWTAVTYQYGEIVSVEEKAPPFPYNEKLANVVIAGTLDPVALLQSAGDGYPDYRPDEAEIAAAQQGSQASAAEPIVAVQAVTEPAAPPQHETIAATAAASADGAYKNVKITVDGEKIILLDENDEQQKSYLADGQVYVPIVPFVSAIGGEVTYDAENNQLIILLPGGNAALMAEITPSAAFTPAPTETPAPKEPAVLGWEEPVDLGYTALSLSDFRVLRELRGTEPYGLFLAEKSGSKYVAAIGAITNSTGSAIDKSAIAVSITVDGQNTYRGEAYFAYNGSLAWELPAAATGTLYLYAEVPEAVAQAFETAELDFGWMEGLKAVPVSLDSCDERYLLTVDSAMAAHARTEPPREKTYFEESPSLPVPTSYVDVTQSGHSSSKSNGKVTKIEYRYRAQYDSDSMSELVTRLITGLQEDGYAIAKSGSDYVVSNGKTKLATLSWDKSTLTVNITPGNESLTKKPTRRETPAAVGEIEELQLPEVKIGGEISTSYANLTFTASGHTDQLLSYTNPSKQPKNWRYYEPNSSSNELFYVQGVFHNKSSKEVNISNIYAELTFDGKEVYNCSVISLYGDGRGFTTSVIAQDRVEYYIYAEVPKKVLNAYKTCEIKIGLTKDFSFKTSSNNRYLFDHCDDVYVLKLK